MKVETQMEAKAGRRVECPSCGETGKRVSPMTLDALLRDKFAQQFKTDDRSCCASNGEGCTSIQDDTGWRFCDSTDCDVVYFSEEADTTFTKSQLKVLVGVKETSGERPLCYCFEHSVATIKEEIRTTGKSAALEDIRTKMNDPGCRCETENPSGSCCLGSVGKGIQIAQTELGIGDSDTEKPVPLSKPSGNKGERIAKVGTLVSAIMASACCWLPLALLAVGVSGAGIASTLETYRPLFIVITFGFLGWAFYITYRPKKAIAKGDHGRCAPEATLGEDCCAPVKGRFNIMAMNKVMLWVVTLLAITFLFFPNYMDFFLTSQTGDNKIAVICPLVSRTTIAIEGMNCEACSKVLQKSIQGVPGVLSTKVDYKNKQAVVSTEACCVFPKDKILQAVTEAGFAGTVKE